MTSGGSFGAGIYCTGGYPEIRGCTITNNHASISGGGVHCFNVADGTSDIMKIRNCVISDNDARDGGGITIRADDGDSAVAILNCRITNNEATSDEGRGGGIYIDADGGTGDGDMVTVEIISSRIEKNFISGDTSLRGGGLNTWIKHPSDSDIKIVNTVIVDNRANLGLGPDSGGGVYNQGGRIEAINLTISGNGSDIGGGWCEAYNPSIENYSKIMNSIFWENSAEFPGSDELAAGGVGPFGSDPCGDPDDESSIMVIETMINPQEVSGDSVVFCNTISDDPEFINAALGDFRLATSSPAIDEGDKDLVPADHRDVDESGTTGEKTPDRLLNDRVAQLNVDMGAYEHDVECGCPADIDKDDNVGLTDLLQVLNDWGSCPVSCPADVDDNDNVGLPDLLYILNDWGPCPCPGTGPADDCADRDLGANCECRDTLTDLIENGTQAQSENARCWLEHYIACHDAQGCNAPADCPDDDPCGKH